MLSVMTNTDTAMSSPETTSSITQVVAVRPCMRVDEDGFTLRETKQGGDGTRFAREAVAEQGRKPDRHVAVGGEVAVDLDRVGIVRGEQVEAADRGRVGEGGIDQVDRDVVGYDRLFQHPDQNQQQAIGHRYELDIELNVEENASETDNIADTVDYGSVAQFAVEIGQNTKFRTIERLSNEICKRLLDSHGRIRSASVTVKKLLPPAPVIVKAVGVQSILQK